MKVAQIYNVVNAMANEVLGLPNYLGNDGNVYTKLSDVPEGVTTEPSYQVKEDLTNIVDIGRMFFDSTDDKSKLFNVLVNHIGRVIFVNRTYNPVVPSVMKDGWEYGSIMEKISAEMPESKSNPKWYPENGVTYNQDKFTLPNGVRAKLFNDAVTFSVEMSFTEDQLKQSFSNAQQLNGFMSLIETQIKNKMTIDYANLIRSTINNFISATVYKEANALLNTSTHAYNFNNNQSFVRAINLLGLYHSEGYDSDGVLTASNCLKDLDFIKFSALQMKLISNRLKDISTLFNIGGRQRFTPTDRQHIVLLSEFKESADVYLQSDTFHNEFVKLPESETINFWQGVGDKYDFSATSKIHTVSKVTADNNTYDNIESIISGIVGVIFDGDALGVCNERNKVTSHYNASGDFINNFYKSFAKYFNDYDENFVVFFVQ